MISPSTISGLRDELQKLANPLAEAVSSGWKSGWNPRLHPVATGMQALGLGLGAKGALQKQDPTGQNRGRFERFGQFVGGQLGSFAGAGLAMKHFPGSKWIAPIGLSMLGQAVGDRVTHPLVHRRMAAENQALRNHLAQQAPATQGVPA